MNFLSGGIQYKQAAVILISMIVGIITINSIAYLIRNTYRAMYYILITFIVLIGLTLFYMYLLDNDNIFEVKDLINIVVNTLCYIGKKIGLVASANQAENAISITTEILEKVIDKTSSIVENTISKT